MADDPPMTLPATASPTRRAALALVEHATFRNFITAVIVINAITLGAATYQGLGPVWAQFFDLVDLLVTVIFVIEIGLKLIAYRLTFFRNGWNVFDLLIVGVALLPVREAQPFTVLRALRVLRILRLISVVPMMRRVIEALFKAIPGMGAIAAVLALLIYVAAVMATTMFGDSVPEKFGTLEGSAFTLFQVMTMDGWRGEVVQPVMEAGNPFAWVFFLTFIFIAAFAVLNLFIALIVDALQQEQEAAQNQELEIHQKEIDLQQREIEEIEAEQEIAEKERSQIYRMLIEMRAEVRALKSTRK
jgi:voltage-gated sodium channel